MSFRLVSRTEFSSTGATRISGSHSRLTQVVRPLLEGKQRTPLSSRVATCISWRLLSGLKGVRPPVEFGEWTRDCSLGHVGKETDKPEVPGPGPSLSVLLLFLISLLILVNIHSCLVHWDGKDPVVKLAGMVFRPCCF